MHQLLLLLPFVVQESDLPMKPVEEFKIELEYIFKPRPTSPSTYIDLTETVSEREQRSGGGGSPLPYLIIHISFQTLSKKEVRIKCSDNDKKTRMSRKIEKDKPYKLDMGYTDDMKDRITAYEFTFVLMDDDKKDTSKIVVKVEEDGTFLVNGIMRGKF
jgi:hypothetical protein